MLTNAMPVKWVSEIQNQRGYTLVELIVILTLIGLLASLAVPRYTDLSRSADRKVLTAGIAELNGRESMTWAKIKTSKSGWIDDETVFFQIDTYLGSDYHWSPSAHIGGGILHCKYAMIKLKRIPSNSFCPGRWIPEE